ncbi:hypothetical protein [Neisseria musculi]|uniref:hypothetical protein n=1 Tax=Neisseria musculi TaxID=1815583 RepID=UPI00164A6C78|nr:hypothetical protein [Neisseria musculi]
MQTLLQKVSDGLRYPTGRLVCQIRRTAGKTAHYTPSLRRICRFFGYNCAY